MVCVVFLLKSEVSFAESLEEHLTEQLSSKRAASSKEYEDSTSLLSLKAKLLGQDKIKYAIEEDVKNACCSAAFNLCEKAPDLDVPTFKSTRALFLKRARASCSKVWTMKLKNEKQICAFYSQAQGSNCAYTPNNDADWDKYLNNLPDCCARAGEYCRAKNAASLFMAKRECFGYGIRTEEEICAQVESEECTTVLPNVKKN